MVKISAVYQIRNKVTGERYVGSSKDVRERWNKHKRQSTWKHEPNKRLYQDMYTYGIENFVFAILAPVEPEHLKEVEQEFIEMLQPAYNNYNANGRSVEKYKASQKAYHQSDKGKATKKAYNQTEKAKSTKKAYNQTEKAKAAKKAYHSQLCIYNGETLTLNALVKRFRRVGMSNPTIEAKKYLVQPEHN